MSLNPEELEKRLKLLENKLLNLQRELAVTEKISKQIQSLVTRNRFPQLQGVEFLSRYIPGEQNRAEGFDFFLNNNKSALWFFYFSVPSYGLSTALFQAYLLLQGRTFFDQAKHTATEAVEHLVAELPPESSDQSQIFIANLHLSTLKWTEASHGRPPQLFTRTSEHGRWGAPQLITDRTETQIQLAPGSRLYFYNRALGEGALESLKLAPSADEFKDDFNSLLFNFEKAEKVSKLPQDICFWGLDISSKKIHLA